MVATQMGNSAQATDDVRQLCEMIVIGSGVIGHVREVHIWSDRPMRGLSGTYWPQGVDRPKDTPPVPSTLAWDLWLGPAANRPYHPAYVPFKWRGWWDFGTGALGDMGCHSFDPAFRALKLDRPTNVEAMSTKLSRAFCRVGAGLQGRCAGGLQLRLRLALDRDGAVGLPRPAARSTRVHEQTAAGMGRNPHH